MSYGPSLIRQERGGGVESPSWKMNAVRKSWGEDIKGRNVDCNALIFCKKNIAKTVRGGWVGKGMSGALLHSNCLERKVIRKFGMHTFLTVMTCLKHFRNNVCFASYIKWL